MKRLTATILAGLLCAGLLAPTVALAGVGGSPDLPGVYFEPSGTFFVRFSLDTGPFDATAFIVPGPGFLPVSGDWNGDGTDGFGVYSTTTGTWYLVDVISDSPGAAFPADYTIFMDATGGDWLPITGNWDGDVNGSDGIGIYNKTTGTMFLVDDATQGVGAGSAPADYTIFMDGTGGDWLPIAGDWDGDVDETDGVGIYNKTTGTMFLVDDATQGVGAGAAPADYTIFMSPDGPSFIPVAGNWDGIAGDGVGIWQQSSGAFFLVNDATQGVGGGAAPADLDLFIEGPNPPLAGVDTGPIVGDWDGLP